MTEHNETTTTLNTLIATLIDSVEGYQKSAGDVDNQRYAEMFNARARERQQAITTLQAAVAQCGRQP
ncbi:PA2169 family four-helix-bundle protein [Novosphingobium sp. MW5]|nr:PA2169 family four-helix-bundle protein [Novosphingobium sp. MW5]